MHMSFVETDEPLILRDTNSKALVTTDRTGLLKARAARARNQKIQHQQTELDQRFQTMGERLDRCEALLHELVQHISKLVAKTPAE